MSVVETGELCETLVWILVRIPAGCHVILEDNDLVILIYLYTLLIILIIRYFKTFAYWMVLSIDFFFVLLLYFLVSQLGELVSVGNILVVCTSMSDVEIRELCEVLIWKLERIPVGWRLYWKITFWAFWLCLYVLLVMFVICYFKTSVYWIAVSLKFMFLICGGKVIHALIL